MLETKILFFVVAAVTLGAAVMVVTSRNLVRSALWLIMTLFGVAVLFVMLEAGFFAAVQVVVYIGAIAILFIFAVMMTRRIAKDTGPQANANWWLAALIAGVLFVGLVWMLNAWPDFGAEAGPLPEGANSISALGQALVSPNQYVLPFELASVLLVAALIGALWLVWQKK